ncbi:MAG: hypothetical protein HY747_08995 [Elusimicrobia bacterium]|nr:hypothetical protein [Elusimicrobiota bacterium]
MCKAVFLMTAIYLAVFAPLVQAETASVSPPAANIREGPGMSYGVVLVAWKYTPLEIVCRCEKGWTFVKDFEGNSGWIYHSLLAEEPAVIVTAQNANIREGPGMGHDVSWIVERGYALKVLDEKGGWLSVTDGRQVEGWIYSQIVWGNKTLSQSNGPEQNEEPEKM